MGLPCDVQQRGGTRGVLDAAGSDGLDGGVRGEPGGYQAGGLRLQRRGDRLPCEMKSNSLPPVSAFSCLATRLSTS